MRLGFHFTPIGERIRHSLEKRFERLDRESITRWFMMRCADKPAMISFCRGRELGTGTGTVYEGQLRELYLQTAKPCIEDAIDETLLMLEQEIRSYPRKDQLAAIAQTSQCLNMFCHSVYNRLADHDRALRGKGDPQSVPRRDFRADLELSQFLIHDRLNAVAAIHVPSQFAAFYKERIAAYAPAYSLAISVLALCVALLKK